MLAEVAAVGAVPFVVLLDQDMPCQAQERCGVGEGADDVGAALNLLGLLRVWLTPVHSACGWGGAASRGVV